MNLAVIAQGTDAAKGVLEGWYGDEDNIAAHSACAREMKPVPSIISAKVTTLTARSRYVYGEGSVSPDGSQVVPDPGVQIYAFSGAMVVNPNNPNFAPKAPNPPPPENSDPALTPIADQSSGPNTNTCAGDPVDCATGLFIDRSVDLVLNDTIPIIFERVYRTRDMVSRSFGIGATNNYDMFLTGTGSSNPLTGGYFGFQDKTAYTYMDLILPTGARVYYPRISPGLDFVDAVYQNTTAPGPFFGSTITYSRDDDEWHLRLKDGTTYKFGISEGAKTPYLAGLIEITDRHGNSLTITRDFFDGNGEIEYIVSPNGRWLSFVYDNKGRILAIVDNANRSVNYAYDSCATGFLCGVTDPNGGTTFYSYNSAKQMTSKRDPNKNLIFTNRYDHAGRVSSQVLGDNTSTWMFNYTLDSTGQNVAATTITDPNGNQEIKTFQSYQDAGSQNYNAYLMSDVQALNKPEQQTTTYHRDPDSNLIVSVIDQLGRQTAYGYDSLGNVSSLTRLAGTSQALTSMFSYDQVFSQLTSATDPLGDTYTIVPNATGDPATITDPLGHSVSLNYYPNGEVQSIADALQNTVQFFYTGGDLTSLKDPVGNVIQFYTDSLGRMTSFADAMGQATQYAYDSLDRLTRITDAKSGVTSFCYDADSNLIGLSDALQSGHFSCPNAQTTFVYDNRDRLMKRTDGLSKSETYGYDANSNILTFTDRKGNVTNYTYDGINRQICAGFGFTGSGYQLCTNPSNFQSTINLEPKIILVDSTI